MNASFAAGKEVLAYSVKSFFGGQPQREHDEKADDKIQVLLSEIL